MQVRRRDGAKLAGTGDNDLQPIEPEVAAAERSADRARRHRQRARLYVWALSLVLALIVIVALVVANTRQVTVSWVFGHAHTSLVWLVIVPAVAGWLAGIATAFVFRRRTRTTR